MTAQTQQTNCKVDPLHYVKRADIPRLARSLEACGSEAFCILPVVVTMLDWWEKNDAYQCTILAPEGGEDSGVCVLIMDQYKRKRLLLYAPENETTNFFKCLEQTSLIPWDSFTVVGRLVERLREPVDKFLEAKGYDLNAGCWELYVMKKSPQDTLALEDPKLPDNISLRPLTEEDSIFMTKNRTYGDVDAEPMTRDSIKYSGGVGAVDKDGNLVGWTRWNHWGFIGQLYVLESHRRLGLGRILTIRLAKEIAKKGRIVAAEVLCTNDASRNLFKSLGFHCDDSVFYREMRK